MSVRRRVGTKRKTASENVTFAPETDSKRKKPESEKRLRRYRSTMTVGIYDRIERALNQRLYLLATSQSPNTSLSREYKVLGQTGNVYTVVISHLPSCTCPDYDKGHLCKHIIFVLHRVLKVSRHSPLIYQQAFLTSELNGIFSKADEQNNDSSIIAEQPIRDAYLEKIGQTNVISTSRIIEQKLLTHDDECPICFESMINETTNILFCSTSCGNNMHQNCFEKWRRAKLSINESVTCPFCRIQWKTSKEQPIHPSRAYLNLAAYSTTDDYDENIDDLFDQYW